MKPLSFHDYIRESAQSSLNKSEEIKSSNEIDSFDDLLFDNIVKTNKLELVKENLEIEKLTKAVDQILNISKPKEVKQPIEEPIIEPEENQNDEIIEEPIYEPTIQIDPLSYKIFRDKAEIFECRVQVEGANVNNAKVRLLLESNEWNIYFDGKMSAGGKCTIPLKKMNILSEGLKGTISLEVIVEDTVFYPWKESFQVQASKKVKVEILSGKSNIKNGPKVTVSGI